MPPSGQVNTSAPLSVVKMTILRVIRFARYRRCVAGDSPDAIVHLRHTRFFHVSGWSRGSSSPDTWEEDT